MKIPGVPAVAVLNEEAVVGERLILNRHQSAFYLHVDDGVACSVPPAKAQDPSPADSLMHQLADSLETLGFIVKDRKSHRDLTKIVGYKPVPHPAML